MLASDDIAAFQRLLGPQGVVCDVADRAPYEQAARYGGGCAAAVLRPATTLQVSEVVSHCVRRGIPFVPQSGNTGLVLGSTPDPTGREVVLSVDRLRAPLEIDAEDRSARVGAGVRLSTLNAALSPHGLFLPIDLGADPMIGGMAATNAGGARFLRYGDMRRHVLGLEVVLADSAGTTLRVSDGLRKDNGRLDLAGLVVGSCGLLGVITEVVVEVHRRPFETAAALLVPRDDEAVMALLEAFERDAGPCLSAFEGMSRAAMARALDHAPSLRAPFVDGLPDYAILVEVARPGRHGLPAAELLEAVLAPLVDAAHPILADAVVGPPERLWALRHALSEGLRAVGPVIGFDLSFARSRVMAFRRAAKAMVARRFPEFEVCDFGHIGDGGVHFNLLQTVGAADPERISALGEAVLDLAVRDFGGSFSGEHGLGRANQAAYERYVDPGLRRLTRDVAGLFSRGASGAGRL